MISLEKDLRPAENFAPVTVRDRRDTRVLQIGTIVVDARMLFFSGIGRYLREILSRWPAEAALRECYIHNSDEQREWLVTARPGASFIRTTASIYSIGEQFLPRRLPASAVYWVPHYNLPWSCRVPLVATVHDAAPLVLKEAFPSLPQRLAARFYFGAVRRKARRVIAVSDFTARELTRHAGVARGVIDVVSNGVDSEWRGAINGGARRPHQLLFVGNLKAHKNLGRLLDAIERVRGRGKIDVTLDVIGQAGGFRAGLEGRTAERLERAPWVRLHGKVDDDRLRALYAKAGALVFPSLYEGFGLPMLEAMAAGCPVIASWAGALPEIGGPDQADGGGVLYFDPRDDADIARRLEYFWQLPATEHARMSEFGRTKAASYSWETTARKTRDVLVAEVRRAGGRPTST